MAFDFNKIFFENLDIHFALEILLRTFVMFLIVLTFLRLTGKKGIRQLSLFEVAIIISLGSAAGDPMFQNDVSIIPAILVFAVILGLYRLITWLIIKSERMETLLEGKPEYIIEDGMFVLATQNTHTFAKDEFFSEMRQQSIEHLGQIRTAILETTGNLSFYYYPDDDVIAGLPVLPKAYNKMTDQINLPGKYACTYCGKVEDLSFPKKCDRCEKNIWVEAITTKRIT